MKKQMHYLLVGYPFAGKTFLAKELERRLGFTRLSIDDVKFSFGYEGISDNDIPDEEWEKIFTELDRRIVKALEEGKTVVNEYAWVSREWRDRARKLAHDVGVETKVIFVDTPIEIVKKRWQTNRKTNSRFDAPDDIFEEAIRNFEKPTDDENVIVYTPDDTIETWIGRYIK